MSEKDEERDEAEAADGPGERDSEPNANDEAEARDADEPRSEKAGRSRKLAKKARREEAERAARKEAMTRAVVVGVLALAVGGAAGWFGHIAQAKAKIRKESVPAAAGSAGPSGPCGDWEKQICKGSGDQSAACMQAKTATGLLTPGTCEVALETVPATLAKVKAERKPCDTLVEKLCKDTPPDSKGCALVREKTPMFPVDRCKEMLENYDQVLAEVKRIDQAPMGMPGHGADDGHGH